MFNYSSNYRDKLNKKNNDLSKSNLTTKIRAKKGS